MLKHHSSSPVQACARCNVSQFNVEITTINLQTIVLAVVDTLGTTTSILVYITATATATTTTAAAAAPTTSTTTTTTTI